MAELTQTQPEVCYVVSILGSKRQWTYFLATLPEALVSTRATEESNISETYSWNSETQVLSARYGHASSNVFLGSACALQIQAGSTLHQSKCQRTSLSISNISKGHYQRPIFSHPKRRALRCVVQFCLVFESAEKDEFVNYAVDKRETINGVTSQGL